MRLTLVADVSPCSFSFFLDHFTTMLSGDLVLRGKENVSVGLPNVIMRGMTPGIYFIPSALVRQRVCPRETYIIF